MSGLNRRSRRKAVAIQRGERRRKQASGRKDAAVPALDYPTSKITFDRTKAEALERMLNQFRVLAQLQNHGFVTDAGVRIDNRIDGSDPERRQREIWVDFLAAFVKGMTELGVSPLDLTPADKLLLDIAAIDQCGVVSRNFQANGTSAVPPDIDIARALIAAVAETYIHQGTSIEKACERVAEEIPEAEHLTTHQDREHTAALNRRIKRWHADFSGKSGKDPDLRKSKGAVVFQSISEEIDALVNKPGLVPADALEAQRTAYAALARSQIASIGPKRERASNSQ